MDNFWKIMTINNQSINTLFKDRPQNRELRALLFTMSVWVL